MDAAAEKRKSERFDCSVPIEGKEGSVFAESQTVDISGGGVGFISRKFIPVNTEMAVEIALTPKSDPLLTLGKVKWVQQLSNPPRYRVGMVFEESSAGLKSQLNRCLGK